MNSKSDKIIKSVWILGSNSDIAKSICIELAKRGCKRFHLISRNKNESNKFVNFLLSNYEVDVSTESIDLTRGEDLNDYDKLEINNYDLFLITAGNLGNNELASQNYLVARNILRVNFLSLVSWFNRIVTRKRIYQNSRLWVLSSVAADRGRPSNYYYGAAKSGLTTLCEGILHSCHDKPFKVRIIKAGFIATKMTLGKVPNFLCASPDSLAKKLLNTPNKRGIQYFPKCWFFIMIIVKLLPSKIMFKL